MKDTSMAKRSILLIAAVLACAAIAVTGCGNSGSSGYHPVIKPGDFTVDVTNPYYPLQPGTAYSYKGTKESTPQTVEVVVTSKTKVIEGVTCRVVTDAVKENGQVVEATSDWYAQNKNGDVWYFGEDSKSYQNGKVVNTNGSWEAGVDGAQPGIIMLAKPVAGKSYRQEYYKGNAEDWAKVVKLDGSATVPYGSFDNCLVTEDTTPLEPGQATDKYYAKNVGTVMEQQVKGGSEKLELVSVEKPK